MTTVSLRYIVDDVAAAVAFYAGLLGFTEELRPAPGFATVARGDLRLLLSTPGGPGGAAQPCQMAAAPSRAGGTTARRSGSPSAPRPPAGGPAGPSGG